MQEFCTPVAYGDNTKNLQKLKEKRIGDFLYIVKNMTYTEYCASYSAGEDKEIYLLFPKTMNTNYSLILSESVITCSPAS